MFWPQGARFSEPVGRPPQGPECRLRFLVEGRVSALNLYPAQVEGGAKAGLTVGPGPGAHGLEAACRSLELTGFQVGQGQIISRARVLRLVLGICGRRVTCRGPSRLRGGGDGYRLRRGGQRPGSYRLRSDPDWNQDAADSCRQQDPAHCRYLDAFMARFHAPETVKVFLNFQSGRDRGTQFA